uniref:Putative uncharacterized protein YCL021W n=3 Tax=Saccharomyces cerevisiae TaxID=4932 RepID=YCC1_YEAST|nr:RecName: Full=Putative uncharacterized protein YCL021W [Saccharomyces cerevisiae S288C]
MMIIIFIELCRIADSLLWIPKSSRRTSSISTYLILLPYKKWNPNNYIKIHVLFIWIPKSSRRIYNIVCIHNIIASNDNGILTIIKLPPVPQKDPCIIFIITALLTSNHECSQINLLE